MALSKEEILDAISEMSVIDIVDLISAMEEKFGVSAAAPVAAAAPAAWSDDDAQGVSTSLGLSVFFCLRPCSRSARYFPNVVVFTEL